MHSALLQDKILSTIIENSQFSLFQVGQAYKRLKSLDKLLSCMNQAEQQGRSLSAMVDVALRSEN